VSLDKIGSVENKW